jgi:hypothetical protein
MIERLGATIAAAVVLCALPAGARGADPPVTLVEDDANFTLANGFVTARVYKQAGTFSLKYKDLDGIRGYWCERAVPFDAALMKRGTNVLKLKVPATSWVNGVLYDYLRLELDETTPPPKTK